MTLRRKRFPLALLTGLAASSLSPSAPADDTQKQKNASPVKVLHANFYNHHGRKYYTYHGHLYYQDLKTGTRHRVH